MTMHLAHPSLSTTGKKKGKKKFASAEIATLLLSYTAVIRLIVSPSVTLVLDTQIEFGANPAGISSANAKKGIRRSGIDTSIAFMSQVYTRMQKCSL